VTFTCHLATQSVTTLNRLYAGLSTMRFTPFIWSIMSQDCGWAGGDAETSRTTSGLGRASYWINGDWFICGVVNKSPIANDDLVSVERVSVSRFEVAESRGRDSADPSSRRQDALPVDCVTSRDSSHCLEKPHGDNFFIILLFIYKLVGKWEVQIDIEWRCAAARA